MAIEKNDMWIDLFRPIYIVNKSCGRTLIIFFPVAPMRIENNFEWHQI